MHLAMITTSLVTNETTKQTISTTTANYMQLQQSKSMMWKKESHHPNLARVQYRKCIKKH